MDEPRELGVPEEDDMTVVPALPVDTDDNDLPDADASGDADDETADENIAVPDR